MTGTPALAAALAKFQAEMPVVPKSHTAKVPTKSGGSYSYTYADLADVTEAAMPLLAKHALAYAAEPDVTERGLVLRGVLMHDSGEERTGTLPLSGNTPQELGSSITYMRRYLLGCLTGIVTDDDDDASLAQKAATKRQAPAQRRQASPPAEMAQGEGITKAQSTALHAAFNDAGITARDGRLDYCRNLIGRAISTSNELTKAEASRVIEALKQDVGDRENA